MAAMSSVVILSREGRLGQGHNGTMWLFKTWNISIRMGNVTSPGMETVAEVL